MKVFFASKVQLVEVTVVLCLINEQVQRLDSLAFVLIV
jgi:hypothetical protein